MSKICGLISDNPDVPVPALLDRMYEASWQSCYRSREVWSEGPAGLGHFSIGAVNTEQQPIIDPASGVLAVFCGKIFDYDANRRVLKEEGASLQFAANDGEFLLHWVRRREAQKLRAINGIFSLVVWDAASSILLLTGSGRFTTITTRPKVCWPSPRT